MDLGSFKSLYARRLCLSCITENKNNAILGVVTKQDTEGIWTFKGMETFCRSMWNNSLHERSVLS
jgi:hypothetical protein